jgi:hypothetical protein
MTFSRTNRIDRRRRVLLDAVASDSDYAVEAVRAKKRARARELENHSEDPGFTTAYRDPGYSQAVRQTCQQRMVQLIPVRRGTLTLVLACMWILWGGLLFSHYWIHVRIPSTSSAATSSNASFASLPVSQLFHLRSSHSIAHWLTCQLWMLTALAAWMIFRLRRHKLDDYRAKYRIWAVLAIVALFSSFDASSSGLYLLGISIDGWARKEIGYGGWPLVLATFASLVGVLGIRLCSELKSAPTSVACWLIGLLSWAISSLLGTGLIKTTWSPASIDLVVGGCWLGGILAVFQAAGIYLRQTYIHAQKRFLQRQGANLKPIQWKLPTISLKRSRIEEEVDETDTSENESSDLGESRKWKLAWPRRSDKSLDSKDSREQATRDTRSSANKQQDRNTNSGPSTVRMNEKNMDSEPIRQEDRLTVDTGLTKKKGWFGIGGNRDAEESQKQTTSIKGDSKSSGKIDPNASSDLESSAEAPKNKRSFWPGKRTASPQPIADSKSNTSKESNTESNTESNSEAPKVKRNWIPKFGKKTIPNEADPISGTKPANAPTATSKKPDTKSQSSDPMAEGSSKRSRMAFPSFGRRLFGMFDGFKLKPPVEQKGPDATINSSKPVPIQQGQVLPSTRSAESDEEDSDDNYSGRPMSKAERKKLRRTQQEDRRAA